jgi:hypothetical protein
MLDIRKRIYFFASILVGLVIVFLLFFLWYRNNSSVEQQTGSTTTTIENTGNVPTATTPGNVDTTAPSVPTLPPEDNYVRQLARIFVERVRSYSNQNDNSHIADVLPIVTDAMASWLKTQDVEQQGEYEGVTTSVIVSTIDSISNTEATVHVEVQELIETRNSRETSYRTGTVQLIFVNGEWKVSGFFWENN